MCGIFGSVSNKKVPITKNILLHRGPDDWGTKYFNSTSKNITIFQSRLSIIGLGKQGHQPYEKYAGKVLTYNGEIYNYRKLREELKNEYGVAIETETDTEVLYECLINFGLEKTLAKINGIFAFSFFDINIKIMYLARDQMGVKPVYYYHQNDLFLFSSESKSFFELGLVKPTLNRSALGEYFANGWVYEPDTLFKDVYKLEAGTYITYNITNNSLMKKRYWDISSTFDDDCPDISAIVEEQTVADVPIGCYFSGGIDSTILAYLLMEKKVVYLNLSLNDSESERVKMMENCYGVSVKKVFYEKEQLNLYKELIYYLDEPIADSAIIPAYLLAKKARELGRIVMLSGMGGDEIDAGYTRHHILANLWKYRIIKYIPEKVLKSIFKGKTMRNLLRMRSFVCNESPDNYYSLTSFLNEKEITGLIGNDCLAGYAKKIDNMCANLPGKKKYFYLDMKGFLSSHNLIYMDKASMAASVEVRVPLLDKNLAKHYFSDIDNKSLVGKKRLKSLLKKLIGDNYISLKKEGFRYFINDWILNEIKWQDVIDFYKDTNVINVDLVLIWLKQMRKDVDSVSMKLWSVYTLYLWITIFNVAICEKK